MTFERIRDSVREQHHIASLLCLLRTAILQTFDTLASIRERGYIIWKNATRGKSHLASYLDLKLSPFCEGRTGHTQKIELEVNFRSSRAPETHSLFGLICITQRSKKSSFAMNLFMNIYLTSDGTYCIVNKICSKSRHGQGKKDAINVKV